MQIDGAARSSTLAACGSSLLSGICSKELLVLFAGAVLPLAFAPFGWAVLAIIALAVLFAVVAVTPRRQALWLAYLFGLGYFGVGVSWIFISISRYGNGPFTAVVVTVAFVGLLAFYPWLAVYTVHRLRPQMDAMALWLVLPSAWVLSEWVRGWFLTGFPWLFLGYSQTDTALADVAPVFGVLGVSLMVALLAGGLAWVAQRPDIRRATTMVTLAVAVLLGTQLLDRQWTSPTGQSLSVALLQGNIAQDRKWVPAYRMLTLERYQELTAQHWGADLVIWPETAVPMWYDKAEPYITALRAAADETNTALVLGMSVREAEGDAYNAVVKLGSSTAFYYKRRLVPFGEYIPLRKLTGPALDILGAPMSNYVPGTATHPLGIAGVTVGTFICYEIAFGAEVARLLPEAQLLINVSNDAWFGDSLGPHQHLQIARMRAIETGRNLLRAANTGVTAVIDHEGRVTVRAPQFEVAAVTSEVEPREGSTPYVRWRDWPVLVFVTAVLGLLQARRVGRNG